MNINDLKCCGNCIKYSDQPLNCDRRKISDYDIDPSDCCDDWLWDENVYSQRLLCPYLNSDGN